MTEKQKRFCDEYLIDLNATQAAIRAGYAQKTAERASDWINAEGQAKPSSKFNPEFRLYIDQQLERIRSENTADAQEVIEYLTSVLRGESKAYVLAFVGDGYQKVVQKPPDEREKLRAAELLGKRYGIFNVSVDMSVKTSDKLADVMDQIGGEGLDE